MIAHCFSDLIEVVLAQEMGTGRKVPPFPDDVGGAGAQRRALDAPFAELRLRTLCTDTLHPRIEHLDRDLLRVYAADLLDRGVLRWRCRGDREEGDDVFGSVYQLPTPPIDLGELALPSTDFTYDLSFSGPSHIHRSTLDARTGTVDDLPRFHPRDLSLDHDPARPLGTYGLARGIPLERFA